MARPMGRCIPRRVVLMGGIGLGVALVMPAEPPETAATSPSGCPATPVPGASAIRWVIAGLVASGSRPGLGGAPGGRVPQAAVDAWLAQARTLGIRSIICLLDENELALYHALPSDLISYYRSRGFAAAGIPVRAGQSPLLSDAELAAVWRAYGQLPKPVLVHCNAGVRAGAAVDYIVQRLGAHA
jgi:protein tyrosine phosphatase (PTP) superfamily phosphohydrolase (DUF442 family)